MNIRPSWEAPEVPSDGCQRENQVDHSDYLDWDRTPDGEAILALGQVAQAVGHDLAGCYVY